MNQKSFAENVNKIPPDLTFLEDSFGFPANEYSRLETVYSNLEQWYSGEKLKETSGTGETETELYPTQYNPLPDAVEKHVSMLFGHYDIQDRDIVKPLLLAPEKDDTWRKRKQDVENYLNTVLYENNFNGLLMDNGINSQIYGGCIFKIMYDEEIVDPTRQTKLWISAIHPRYFVGIPSGLNFWDLHEAWVIRPISVKEAVTRYGISYAGETEKREPNDITWLVEHYTKKKIETVIDGKIARRKIGTETVEMNQNNPYGIVPFVYIPHVRDSGFYGTSLISGIEGLLKEINLRIGDFGDAVTTDAHTTIVVSGQSDLRIDNAEKIAPGVKAVKVRLTGAGMGKDTNPDISQLKQLAHVSMGELVDRLLDMFSKTVSIPPVAYGVDEGSQRSSATLILRMWPLIAHAQIERAYWTVGLNRLYVYALHMLSIKEPNLFGKEITKFRVKQDWSPYLPKDRESIINEANTRFAGKMSSLEKIFDLLGDVDDPEEEKKLIYENQKEIAKIMAEMQPAPFGGAKPQNKQVPLSTGANHKKVEEKQDNKGDK